VCFILIIKTNKNREGNKMKCLNCNSSEGTLLKEFNNEQNYSWYDLSEMTEVCASCGSENIKIEEEVYIETLNGPEIRDNGKNYK
jgi:Zn finger protein HypA/HybF involved in hydrogenase expression